MATCASTTTTTTTTTWNMSYLRASLPNHIPSNRHVSVVSSVGSFPSTHLRLCTETRRNKPKTELNSFLGLGPISPLHSFFSLRSEESTSFSFGFPTIDHGSKVYAMRHGRRVPKLNRPPDQRKALLRGLTTQLLKYGRIKTTRARASAMRKYVDKMITLAKDGSLHKRRQALGFIYEKTIVHALFAEVPERYGERNGGYTRIIRTLPRRGDNAPMAYIELV